MGKYKLKWEKVDIIINIVAMLNMSVLSVVLSVSVRCNYERKDL